MAEALVETELDTIKAEAVEHVINCVTITNKEGIFLFVNKYAAQTLGYEDPTELIGKHYEALYSTEQMEQTNRKALPAITEKGNWQGRAYIKRKNGTEFCAQLNVTLLPSGNECCVFYDITNELERENKLAHLNLAVELASDGIALLGPDEKYNYLNDNHVKHFGYEKEEELIGKTWRVIYPQEEIDRIETDLFPKLSATGRWQGETLGITKSGNPINQEITLTALPNGGLICIMRNITERKKEENERKQLALVASNTNNAVIITDENHSIQWINKAAEDISGFSLETLPDKSIRELLNQLSVTDFVLLDIEQRLKKEGQINTEFSIKDRHGKNHWLYGNVNSVTEKDKVKNYVYVLVDITPFKEAENQLMLSLEKEKALNELKTRFVTLTSHEFRTPLAGIQSSTDILGIHLNNAGSVSYEILSRHLNQINDEVARMTELMENVLVLGKINSGRFDFRPQQANLTKFIETVVAADKYKGYEKSIELHFAGEERMVNFDGRLLQHMLDNLLSNAFKYSSGSISPPQLQVIFKTDEIDFVTTDYGIGIPVGDQNSLFESFFRARNTQNIPGTGLGLPIVQQFAELHGGCVVLMESTPGKTIFKLTIKG
jgi:PAS domain S-box-containing protein